MDFLLPLAACVLMLVLLVIDYLQTCAIAAHPERWRERNPVLRFFINQADTETGKRLDITCYFLLASIVMGGMAWAAHTYAGHVWGLIVLMVFAATELVCVANNFLLGIKPSDTEF